MKTAVSPSLFQANERWSAAGDSLTQGGFYHHFVHLYYVTRFPENRLELFNCGINGDTTSRVLARFDADVLNHKPTLVSVLLGANDVGMSFPADATSDHIREQRAKAVTGYRDGMRIILQRLRDAGVRSLLITPGLYDETVIRADAPPVNRGLQATLVECADVIRELGVEFSVPVIDWTQSLMNWNAQLQKDDPAATLIGTDRMHPGEQGSFVMAFEFLKAQGAPKEVSHIALNAATGQVDDLINCSIFNIQKEIGSIAFDCLEKSLPMPVPESCRSLLLLLPFIERFNVETLQIKDLPSGSHEVRVDGVLIGNFSAEQLQAGVNLAVEPVTPQYQQALAVTKLVERRSQILRVNLRVIAEIERTFLRDVDQTGKSLAELKAILDDRIVKFKIANGMTDGWQQFMLSQAVRYIESKPLQEAYQKEASDLLDQIYSDNNPVPHRIEIVFQS